MNFEEEPKVRTRADEQCEACKGTGKLCGDKVLGGRPYRCHYCYGEGVKKRPPPPIPQEESKHGE